MSKPDPNPTGYDPKPSSDDNDPVADLNHTTEELEPSVAIISDGERGSKEEEEGRVMVVYPVRPDAEDCSFYMRTGSCKYGSSCKFNHPLLPTNLLLHIDRERVREREREEDEENPRLMECKYYFRTGGCKYGETCRFSHTKEQTSPASRQEHNFLGLPIRPREKECPFDMRNASCKFGGDCKFNHPDPTSIGGVDSPLFRGNDGGSFSTKDAPQTSWSSSRHLSGTGTAPFFPLMHSQNHGYQASSVYPPERSLLPRSTYNSANNQLAETSSFSQFQQQMTVEEFPERPDQPECSYYVKTGDCKFKYKCKYHHPKNRLPKQSPSSFNDKGLPLRPGQSMCTHYSRYGICKFGPACRFDHSIPPAFSSSSSQPVEAPQVIGNGNENDNWN
ncbi:hypothetical protein Bca52824_096323 [Brassica carinata]|uniref:C3H1-type domain-containing protein n=1 Tax=Brassica carinata TaxID=52824 RepID=A0A8X7NXD7_BRACI|nr:hypothetical protein Bca52824_096323 [Brassica carinata]